MIPHKQLSLADFLLIAKINLITINTSSFPCSTKPSTLMKLSLSPLCPISTLLPADPADIFSTPCSRLCSYNLFSPSLPFPSSSFFSSIHRNCGISAVSMLFPMPPSLLVSNRISYWTYNPCSTISSI